ncbi:DUF948 domain-containing protein [Oceanobacillus alkalisoli]|uniref:DUF948 domain-containing protein n=1 Tax=Oceanobacillus alkalisoli TaxID=2925113 RepID=UPI001EEFBEAC|nr:DUF948 domain-containing protein [Oceanobacillus alkalisoli]MCF3943286.1 DUF948 domain-containing protein [Oceanobacillus alkalisoli]MCG5103837.1 DUF948 domain-containing protein [Oceanobacillus alkalisoli]
MEVMLYIAIIIAVIALVVLTIYIIHTVKVTKGFLNETKTTLQGLETQLKGITDETTELLNKTNRLAADVELKSSKIDGLVDGAQGVGETMKEFDHSLKQLTNSISRASQEDQEKTNQAVKWGASILEYVLKRKESKY